MQELDNQQQHKDITEPGKGIQHDPLPPAVDYAGVTPSARYQFRGLARRALSYHRRQRVTNVICLVIWPALLVVLASLMAGTDLKEYKGKIAFCTNDVDPENDPDFFMPSPPYPENGANRPAAAWYPLQFGENQQDHTSCVRWFGESFPIKAPYEKYSSLALHQPDSYYIPPPSLGWFKKKELRDKWHKAHPYSSHPPPEPSLFDQKSLNQTVYYTVANAQVAQALGTFSGINRSFISEVWPPNDTSIIYNSSAPGVKAGTGIFGVIPDRFASSNILNKTTWPNGTTTYGYYPMWTTQLFLPVQDQNALDKTIVNMVAAASSDDGFYSSMQSSVPWGSIAYETLDLTRSNVKATMQFGQTPISSYSMERGASSGLRQMIAMTQLTNAIVKIKYSGQYAISQGLRALPLEWDNNVLKGGSLNTVAPYLFPFALSFLMPTFVSILVQEKEDRHRMMMAMNGLKSVSYYMAHYVEFMTMQMILLLVFCLTCVAVSSQFLLRTHPLIIIILMIIWAHVQTTFAFLLGTFFSHTRRATLAVYFLVAITCIMGSVASLIFKDGTPLAWYIYPYFAFFNIISVGITHSSRINGLYPLVSTDLAPGTTLFTCLIMMLGESVLFILLTFYIDAVAPSEYGVQKPWHFPISSFFNKRKSTQDLEAHLAPHQQTSYASSENDQDILEGGDADVYTERDRVRTLYNPARTPLIISNLFHRYPGKVEPALKGMSFGVETNTVLGLLGPNGAGKSTLIHLLTGLYRPTSGTAYVAGANIRTDMSTIHSKIGVCPQHDILWGDLTVADHLLFYSRLRGIPPHLEQQAVTYAIASVSLSMFRDRQVKGLSGGEKRRVSIAISLLGDNTVIFLDEPSTGLDPAVRRVIWDIINRVKINRTVVLTTHSMEEADILSDRIAIMTSGRLRCIGTSLHLKDLYGSGFRLDISSQPGRLQEACESVEHQVLRGLRYRRIDKFTNATTYEFELEQQQQQQQQREEDQSAYGNGRGQLSRIFSCLSQPGRFPAIEDWGLSQTTLEDVFIKIVTDGDAALAMPSIVNHK
ncbi:hypothetical protein EDD11_003057 [Mortierella claussenii]|nr:hypothetical protein EDD11_003057 [Mortierella claussenii]